MNNPIPKGKVSLIGFGPGDPDLMTVKAMKKLASAEIIFFDDLISQSFLEQYQSKKVYVGKRKGVHSKSQEEINQILYEATLEYKSVVRLKGGDPFIFGRGGEELAFLSERGINVEVIPGVTASMAAAASAKIPLTLRGVSKYLTFLPTHKIESEPLHFPDEGTMVFYMGASKLQALSEQLLNSGRSPSTPVAIIRNASLEDQEIEITNAGEMGNSKLGSPLVIIVGDVVLQKS